MQPLFTVSNPGAIGQNRARGFALCVEMALKPLLKGFTDTRFFPITENSLFCGGQHRYQNMQDRFPAMFT